METYRVNEEWDVFVKALENFVFDQDEVGFMHRGNEIYIRTNDEALLAGIGELFELIPWDRPPYDEINSGWVFVCNPEFFR
jgi:hypothetical protein